MIGSSDKVKGKMLKLIKNDFLASARVIPLFYIIEACSLLGFVIGDKTENTKVLVISVIVSIAVSFLLIFVTFFFVINDYVKALFGQQGYLSFTLPVSSKQLLGSKLIVYGLWMILSYANFVVVLDFLSKYIEHDMVGEDTINTASSILSMFMGFPSKAQIITYAIYFIFTFFLIVLSFVVMVYFSIAASHMRPFQKRNVIWAVLIFVGTVVIFVAAIDVLDRYLGVYIMLREDKSFEIVFGDATGVGTPLSLMPHLFMLVQNVIYFFLTADIMHKRINIK